MKEILDEPLIDRLTRDFGWIDPRKGRKYLAYRRFAQAGFNVFVDRLLSRMRRTLRERHVRQYGGQLPKPRRSKRGPKRLL